VSLLTRRQTPSDPPVRRQTYIFAFHSNSENRPFSDTCTCPYTRTTLAHTYTHMLDALDPKPHDQVESGKTGAIGLQDWLERDHAEQMADVYNVNTSTIRQAQGTGDEVVIDHSRTGKSGSTRNCNSVMQPMGTPVHLVTVRLCTRHGVRRQDRAPVQFSSVQFSCIFRSDWDPDPSNACPLPSSQCGSLYPDPFSPTTPVWP